MPLHINGWNDLTQFGINALTGESCAYSMRLLCDLNEDGVDLMRQFLGLPATVGMEELYSQFSSNWNSRVGDKPAIASIMLPRGVYDDLCRFIIFLKTYDYALKDNGGGWSGYTAVWLTQHRITAVKMEELHEGRLYRNPRNPEASVGSRNVHQATNRTD